jgi:hypothetical protein
MTSGVVIASGIVDDAVQNPAGYALDSSNNVVGMASGANRFELPRRFTGQPIKIATFGDSTSNIGATQSPDDQNVSIFTTAFPGGGVTFLTPSNDKFAINYFYRPAAIVFNGGVTGENTTQMLARDSAGASTTRKAVTDLINANPDAVIFRGGSINDISGFTTATSQATIDAVYARHVLLLNRLMASGALIIDEGFFGYSPGAGVAADLAFRRATLVSLNARYAAYAAQFPVQIRFLDLTGIIRSADGNYITGLYDTTDGIHVNEAGGMLLAQAEASLLDTVFGGKEVPRFRGTNIVTNPMFDAYSNFSYGDVPTGYSLSAAGGGTCQNAKIEVINGRPWWTSEIVFDGTPGEYGQMSLPYDPTTMSISANDVYGFECDFMVANQGGGVIPLENSNKQFRVVTYKSAAGRVEMHMWRAGVLSALASSSLYAHASGAFKFQEPSANLTNSSNWTFVIGTDVAGTYKLGISNPRLVKLGVATTSA